MHVLFRHGCSAYCTCPPHNKHTNKVLSKLQNNQDDLFPVNSALSSFGMLDTHFILLCVFHEWVSKPP